MMPLASTAPLADPQTAEYRSHRPWRENVSPERILVLRLHAIGDVALTLPALAALHEAYPCSRVDLLTGVMAVPLGEALTTIHSVHTFVPSSTPWGRLLQATRMGARLSREHFDVVLDLQRNWVSRMIRRACRPKAWSEFDRFSPLPASERVRETVARAGLEIGQYRCAMPIRTNLLQEGTTRLLGAGWDGSSRLVCLNPAGLWKTRNWPLDYYRELADLLRQDGPATILLLGDERLVSAASKLERMIPQPLLNFAGKTSLQEAFGVLQYVDVLVSEDSGLMHMAWASGIPTVALFGSTNHVQSSPVGAHAVVFHSGDLECGDCMSPECIHGDIRCLTRRTPDEIMQAIQVLPPRRKVSST